MVIEKIGNINNITEPKKNKPISEKKEGMRSDSIEISNEGKIAAESAKNTQIIRETPDDRIDRVKDIKMRIDNGSYNFNDNKILEMVADRIVDFLVK
jgi:anti-sigma28 factor (negative regulator of flagellin synthesis)